MLEARVDRLEAALQRLADAQAQTQEELRALASAQRRTEERLQDFAARMDQLAARMDQLTARMDELAARMDQLTARMDQLAARMDQLAARMDQLASQVSRLTTVVGVLKGDSLERRYRERAPAYFDDLLRGIHALSSEELAALLDEALSRGVLSRKERRAMLDADVIVRGRRWEDGSEAYLSVEVSSVVDSEDVRRALDRAELLARATGRPAIATVAGETITEQAEQAARALKVWRVLDGRAFAPE
jgi:outer membrane murein-binding lipoprotein Lpp